MVHHFQHKSVFSAKELENRFDEMQTKFDEFTNSVNSEISKSNSSPSFQNSLYFDLESQIATVRYNTSEAGKDLQRQLQKNSDDSKSGCPRFIDLKSSLLIGSF